MNSEFILEMLNGDWGIAAAALGSVCGFYLAHEVVARKSWGAGWRRRSTMGMRRAIALLTMSAGVFIRSAETFRWRASGAGLSELSQGWLLFGGALAVIGFLCVIREISKPLYGEAPWLWTLAAMAIFTAGSIGYRIF